ncbi:hypothetical protein DIPPA_03769 [Diplonema papillatum]|nr:hypothetical protein DIPPA_03769 [Diplonema papillatum]
MPARALTPAIDATALGQLGSGLFGDGSDDSAATDDSDAELAVEAPGRSADVKRSPRVGNALGQGRPLDTLRISAEQKPKPKGTDVFSGNMILKLKLQSAVARAQTATAQLEVCKEQLEKMKLENQKLQSDCEGERNRADGVMNAYLMQGISKQLDFAPGGANNTEANAASAGSFRVKRAPPKQQNKGDDVALLFVRLTKKYATVKQSLLDMSDAVAVFLDYLREVSEDVAYTIHDFRSEMTALAGRGAEHLAEASTKDPHVKPAVAGPALLPPVPKPDPTPTPRAAVAAKAPVDDAKGGVACEKDAEIDALKRELQASADLVSQVHTQLATTEAELTAVTLENKELEKKAADARSELHDVRNAPPPPQPARTLPSGPKWEPCALQSIAEETTAEQVELNRLVTTVADDPELARAEEVHAVVASLKSLETEMVAVKASIKEHEVPARRRSSVIKPQRRTSVGPAAVVMRMEALDRERAEKWKKKMRTIREKQSHELERLLHILVEEKDSMNTSAMGLRGFNGSAGKRVATLNRYITSTRKVLISFSATLDMTSFNSSSKKNEQNRCVPLAFPAITSAGAQSSAPFRFHPTSTTFSRAKELVDCPPLSVKAITGTPASSRSSPLEASLTFFA